jgi:hypothetical protein
MVNRILITIFVMINENKKQVDYENINRRNQTQEKLLRTE